MKRALLFIAAAVAALALSMGTASSKPSFTPGEVPPACIMHAEKLITRNKNCLPVEVPPEELPASF